MSESIIITIKGFFLLGFTLHKLEELFWLPQWFDKASHNGGVVTKKQVIYMVIFFALFGYVLAITDIFTAQTGSIADYLFLWFICVTAFDTLFWHVTVTFMLKRYTPGLITGLAFNIPITYLLISHYQNMGVPVNIVLIASMAATLIILLVFQYSCIFNWNFTKKWR